MDPTEAARKEERELVDPETEPAELEPEWDETEVESLVGTEEELEEVFEGEDELQESEEQEGKRRRRGLGAWVGARAKSVASKLYESRAADLEERARRAVGSAYRDSADDIQGRAVQAMRDAIAQESERIKEAIEHSVHVKKREMRMSLLVLVTASVLYLLLYWLTHRGGAAT